MVKALSSQAVVSAILKSINAILGFTVAVAIARLLGAGGYGIYTSAFVLISIFTVLVQFGLPNLVMRETAVAEVSEDWDKMKSIWFWATKWIIIFTLCIASVAILVAMILHEHFGETQITTSMLALMLIPLVSLSALRTRALQGLRHVIISQIPEMLVKPSVLLILILFLSNRISAEPQNMMVLLIIASFISFSVGAILLYRKTPEGVRKANVVKPYGREEWLKASGSFALVAGAVQINQYADIMIIGMFHSAADVGQYRAVYQLTFMASFGTHIVSSIMSPYFTRFYHLGDFTALHKYFRLAVIGALLIAIPVTAVFLLFGKDVLQILFGVDYRSAYPVLVILSLMHLTNAIFGPLGLYLNMTKREHISAKFHTYTATLNIVLNFLLIPYFNIVGAGVATLISYLVLNIFLSREVRENG